MVIYSPQNIIMDPLFTKLVLLLAVTFLFILDRNDKKI
jgi:hypothetical protein